MLSYLGYETIPSRENYSRRLKDSFLRKILEEGDKLFVLRFRFVDLAFTVFTAQVPKIWKENVVQKFIDHGMQSIPLLLFG